MYFSFSNRHKKIKTMKTKNENSINVKLNSGGKKMKTKKMTTLLVAMLLGVMVSAQTTNNGLTKSSDQFRVDHLKIMMTEIGFEVFDLFSADRSVDGAEIDKGTIEKCKNQKDSSRSCTMIRKQGAKPFPFFPKELDNPVKNPNKITH